MISLNTGVRLVSAGIVSRYGHGDDARSAPPGRRLVAFRTADESGERGNRSTAGKLSVLVPGQPNRSAPATLSGDTYVVVAVPVGATATLRLDDAGYAQTLSLPAGTPGAANLAVLARTHRSAEIGKTSAIPVRFANGTKTANATFHISAGLAELNFWVPGHTTFAPGLDPTALLSVRLTYTDSLDPGSSFGFEPQLLKLMLPDGHTVAARNIAPSADKVFNVFEVPADITKATLVVSGSVRDSGVSLTLRAAARFPISFAAG